MAIVWTIAGAFQLVFSGQVWLVDRAVQFDWVPQWMTLPSVQATDCSAVVRNAQRGSLDDESLKRVRAASFDLGFALGATTAFRNSGVADSEQSRKLRSAPALALGVPAPEIPPLHSVTYALSEFKEHMLTDSQCIGALLAKKYSPRYDALYRFGAFAGYNIVRIKFPQLGPLFVTELRQFGKDAGLPGEVWDPFIDVHADVRTAVARVDGYLQAELAWELR